jgi:hypothetical protein
MIGFALPGAVITPGAGMIFSDGMNFSFSRVGSHEGDKAKRMTPSPARQTKTTNRLARPTFFWFAAASFSSRANSYL